MVKEKEYQEIVFSLDRYSWKRTPEEANKAMWEDITKLLNVLFTNDYIAVVYQDEIGIVVVQFEHDERKDAWGCVNPYWMTEEDYYEYMCNKEECDELSEYGTSWDYKDPEVNKLKKENEE